jgi:Secretion system C-terminal sorting domain
MLTKKLLSLTAIAALFVAPLAAQKHGIQSTKQIPQVSAANNIAVPMPRPVTGLEPASEYQQGVPSSNSMLRAVTEEVVGTTTYDLQTNGTEQPRFFVTAAGEVHSAYTGATTNNWSDRGSYYNVRSAWNTGTTAARIETVRTGFTNYVVTGNGTEIAIAHRGNGTGKFLLHMTRRTAGGAWVESDLPTNTSNGGLWAKVAADGQYVHVLMLTVPVGSGGVRVGGMDGHVLYYRSPDAGATWDIVDGVIPGLDSTAYRAISADAYAITARDGKVAVATFDSWNHSELFVSNNNGTTWDAPKTILDFPLVGYEADQGYTFDQVGMNYDSTTYPDSLAIETNDGGGSLVIDALGTIHAFAGRTFVLDDDLTDDNSSYYPGTNGLIYWNETANEASLISGSLDVDGDNTLNITINVGSLSSAYGSGLSSMSTCAADDAGGIYVLYSATLENLIDNGGFTYRHIYMMKSPDFGASWGDPIDVTYRSVIDGDSALQKLTECVFPSVNKQLINANGGKLHYGYQRDFIAGSSVLQSVQNGDLSEWVYIADADAVGTKENNPTLAFGLAPNPTNGNTTMTITLPNAAETTLQVFDVAGTMVRNQNLGSMVAGTHNLTVPSAQLNNGIYFVRVQSGTQFGIAKLMIVK